MVETVMRARDEEGTERVSVFAGFIILPLTNFVWLLTANCFVDDGWHDCETKRIPTHSVIPALRNGKQKNDIQKSGKKEKVFLQLQQRITLSSPLLRLHPSAPWAQ